MKNAFKYNDALGILMQTTKNFRTIYQLWPKISFWLEKMENSTLVIIPRLSLNLLKKDKDIIQFLKKKIQLLGGPICHDLGLITFYH